jgi:hypothetical protein
MNSKSTLLEKNLEKKDAQVCRVCACVCVCVRCCGPLSTTMHQSCARHGTGAFVKGMVMRVAWHQPRASPCARVRTRHQAEKRRETLLVGLNKTREQLSSHEERMKAMQLELQRNQMDLLAKTSERAALHAG